MFDVRMLLGSGWNNVKDRKGEDTDTKSPGQIVDGWALLRCKVYIYVRIATVDYFKSVINPKTSM